MNSLHELFDSQEHRRNKGHFRNLVMVARADGMTTTEEEKLLEKIARGIGLTSEQTQEILKDPTKYPMEPPVDKEERLDRLVALIEMVQADGEIDSNELDMLSRHTAGLGFSEEEAAQIFNKCLHAFRDGKERQAIVDELLS